MFIIRFLNLEALRCVVIVRALAAGCSYCNLFVLFARAGCGRGARVDGDAAAEGVRERGRERERRTC